MTPTQASKQKTTIKIPPAPKKPAPAPQSQPRRSVRIQQRTAPGEGSSSGIEDPNIVGGFPDFDTSTIDIGHVEFAFCANTELALISDNQGDPRTLKEAQSREDWPMWKTAMDIEIDTLLKANTWTPVQRPEDKNIVGSKWVFRIKYKADGSIDKYKARLVARGFTQIYGVDYYDTYSPVARISSLRAVLAIAAHNDWEIESFDFNGAYLNGELDEDEEIYMQPPPGYDFEYEGEVLKLEKSLYGLKQAGRRWYETLSRALIDLGFWISENDPGIFIKYIDEDILILVIYVDDCTLTGSSAELIDEYIDILDSIFSLTHLGPIYWLLGIKIIRDRDARTISLSQTTYITNIIERFHLQDAKPLKTPMTPGTLPSKDDCPSDQTEHDYMAKVPYREAIGSIMYAAIATRPDIAFAVSTLSQFLENPGRLHWEAVKRVLRYLSGTKDFKLTYGTENHELTGYTDADGAAQKHRKAISGHVFLINGGAISWSSRKQELVTLSTTEAEYVAATHAAKEATWLRKLLKEINIQDNTPTTLFCDNQSALKLATDDNYHARTKHIDTRYHYIRDVIAKGIINTVYCPTEDMVADALTKPLPAWKTFKHAQDLGLRRD
jgi:hypothetical protein